MYERDFTNEILDDVECYKKVLSRELKKFPKHFWEKPYSMQSAKSIVKYLFEEKLCIDLNNLHKILSIKFFQDHKLLGMLRIVFNYKIYDLVEYVYPNKYAIFQFNTKGSYFASDDNVKEAVAWIAKNKLDGNVDIIPKVFTFEYIYDLGMTSVLKYKKSIYDIVNTAYPNKFRPWEFKQISAGYWGEDEHISEAVKWLVEEKLKCKEDEIPKKISKSLLVKFNLDYVCRRVGGIYELVNIAYPNKFKVWQFNNVSANFWKKKENIVSAVIWLVDTKLDSNKNRINSEFTVELFNINGLSTLPKLYTLGELLNIAYPGEFNNDDFGKGRFMKNKGKSMSVF